MSTSDQPSEIALPIRDESLLRGRFTVVWVLLIAATIASFWVGTDHGLSSSTGRGVVILAIAFVKVRFVGLYFMDLRSSPYLLRGIFEAYCMVVCLAMMAVYLFD